MIKKPPWAGCEMYNTKGASKLISGLFSFAGLACLALAMFNRRRLHLERYREHIKAGLMDPDLVFSWRSRDLKK